MNKENRFIHLVGLLYLGTLSPIVASFLYWVEFFQKGWLVILTIVLVALTVASYYALTLFLAEFYLGVVGKEIKRLYNWNKKVFIGVSAIIIFGILFPIFSKILGNPNTVKEIYIYALVTGLITYLVIWFAKNN